MDLKKSIANTSCEIKGKINSLSQELKETRKSRNQSTGSLMAMIEATRVKFDTFTENERRKRVEYDRIVLGLLDRTVDQG